MLHDGWNAPCSVATTPDVTRAHWDAAIATDHAARGETIKTLGARYGLHYSQISRTLARAARSATRVVKER